MNYNKQVRILKLLIVYRQRRLNVLSFAKLEYKDEDLFEDNMEENPNLTIPIHILSRLAVKNARFVNVCLADVLTPFYRI